MIKHQILVNTVKDVLNKKQYITLKAKQGSLSMRPLILDDSRLYIEKLNSDPIKEIKIGDLLLLDFYTEFCCHRVIHKYKDKVLTKGDNNPKIDFPILPEQILGKVTGISRHNKNFNLNRKINYVFGYFIAFHSRYSSTGHHFNLFNKLLKNLFVRLMIYTAFSNPPK